MTKNILLAATAASVMAFAGAASAHTLTFRTTAPGIGSSIDVSETGGAALPFKLAAEAKTVTPTFQQFDLTDSLSSGNLPSGNVVLTINLGNATFGAALTAGNVFGVPSCTTFTAVPSLGGAAGSNTATFVISNSAANCPGFNLNLPIAPGASGNVTVQTSLATEFGVAIDGRDSNVFTVVTRPGAFAAVIDGAIGGGALNDTFATLTVTPVYTTFKVGADGHDGATETATVGQLGTIRITVDTTAYRDLNSNPVSAADVTDADTVVTGNFSAFNGAGGGATLGAAAATFNAGATTATINNQQAALTAAAQAFRVTRETGGVIPSSTYQVALTYTLDAAFYNQETVAPAFIEAIGRDGTNVVFPWMNSTSIQAITGTTNLIRLGNISGSATGPVFAQVLNAASSASGYTPAAAPVQIATQIDANGELVINTATLTAALGNWGRGDLQISVEAPSNIITARRYATLSNGSITEFESGTVANDQNNTNVP